MMNIKNILTIDVEDMSHSRYENVNADKTLIDEHMLDRSVNELLDLLECSSAKATFFVLGVIARKMPALVRKIRDSGHEIGSHGYSHTAVYDLTPSQFKRDIHLSLRALEDASGDRVLGFRAPYWSITARSLWALDIIAEAGMKFDSSISPVVTFLYGIKGAPSVPYLHPKGFWEVPPTTWSIMGRLIIVGGGFYLRALPYWMTEKRIAYLNEQGKRGMVYMHPHELINQVCSERLSFTEDFILNFNKAGLRKKFICLLKDFRFCSVSEAVGLYG